MKGLRFGARVLAIAFVLVAAAGCGTSSPRPSPSVSQSAWTAARERLAILRASEMTKSYVVELQIGMREPRTGKTFRGRGALAVQPHSALRMILVGPGGKTALDVWLTRDAWRLSIPATDLNERGTADVGTSRGLPIAFLRWWFLSPTQGRLLYADMNPAGATYVLRDGASTVDLRTSNDPHGPRLFATRREGGVSSRLGASRESLAPHAGDRAQYVEEKTGLEVDVIVLAVSKDEPDPAAFLDPDAPSGVSL